jgi:hypothetical protein
VNRLLREPLLHFLVVGAAIFLIASLRAAPHSDAARSRIVITAGDVQHIADGFARTWQRPPTPAELAGLVDERVRDEVYYREALGLGLERDDIVVRRRLRQKMEFIVEDAVAGPPPTDADLQAHLDAHPEVFRHEATTSFRQVYLDRDRRGPRTADDVRLLVATLGRAGAAADTAGLGDSLMIDTEFVDVSDREVARTFGDAFATALASLPVAEWSGPVESGYGLHVVLVRDHTPGRVPTLAGAREAVLREFLATRRTQMMESAYAALRARYEVIVDPAAASAVAAR